MLKIIKYIFLILVNICLGYVSVFVYTIGMNGFWQEPIFIESIIGFFWMLVYLLILILQIYYFIIKKLNFNNKKIKIFLIISSVIIFIYVTFSVPILYKNYIDEKEYNERFIEG